MVKPEELPLLNKRIVVTRAEDQSEEIVGMLKKAGATVIQVPTIKIVPADLSSEDQSFISSFCEYDAIIFPSANAVRSFFAKVNHNPSSKVKPHIITIGKKTGEAVKEFGITPDFIPGKFTSQDLMKSLAYFKWKAKRVLIPVGNLSNNELADFMRSNGAFVDQVVVYNTLPNNSIEDKIKSEIGSGQFDLVVFYSPSQAKNFIDIFGIDILKKKQIATIGPTTRKAVEHYGLEVAIMPDNSTTENLVASLLEYEKT
ncbi:MAG TPA: uroporphyrinogen-III synthase [Candidatus Acidoferrales bacterium]|nr:uroporphyrinogen-III synthase [Candidatus Acidoferrales bacterium]